jgi:hypothetical protein
VEGIAVRLLRIWTSRSVVEVSVPPVAVHNVFRCSAASDSDIESQRRRAGIA